MLVKLKDICKVVSGATPTTNISSYYDGDIFWITPKDLADNNNRKFIYQCSRKITKSGYNSCSTVMIPKNNILISTRAPIGYIAINSVECCTNQGFKSLICDVNKVNSNYLYYLLKSRMKEIELLGSGTTFKEVSKTSIENFEVDLPSLNIQQKISSILSLIDAQIERNNTIVKRLQVLVHTIYTRCFLQFDFLNDEGKPYKSSGGKMVWNERLNREIPEGWQVKSLKDCCKIVLGGTPKTDETKYWNGNINWLNSGEIANFPIINSELKITTLGMNNSATTFMKKGTTVVSITGNLRASILAIDSCANQSVVGILENSKFKSAYIYPFIKNMIATFSKISTGNCQQHINKGTIENAILLIPSEKVLKEYYEKVSKIYVCIFKNSIENQKLISLRNVLLSLLINGQLK